MNGFIVLDPVGIPQKSSRNAIQRIENLEGKRIGFIWGMHELSIKFWPVLEEEAVTALREIAAGKVHYDRTSNEAVQEYIEELNKREFG